MIVFENVDTSYNQKDLVLKKVNLQIKEKEKVFFIGKSGVGKTTLFNCLINRKIITNGKVTFKDYNIQKISSKKYKRILRSFALISQINTCSEELNVFNNIFKDLKNYPKILKILGFSSKKTTEKILNILNKVEIFDKAFSKFKDLSGGQKQRVEIAKELINEHNLVIADEPTSSLDFIVAQKIIDNLLKNTKTTALISVHNLDLIPKTERVIGIKNKRIVFDKLKNRITKKDIAFIYGK